MKELSQCVSMPLSGCHFAIFQFIFVSPALQQIAVLDFPNTTPRVTFRVTQVCGVRGVAVMATDSIVLSWLLIALFCHGY
jgi:hypothetical protein